LLGGDTDTNACIVGGLIGAWEGKARIPEDSINRLLTCNIKKGSKSNRPSSIQTNQKTIEKISQLYSIAPKTLSVIL